MGLTNAERQARWRERQKQKLAEAQAATAPRYITESKAAREIDRLQKKLAKATEEAADNKSRWLFARDHENIAVEQRDKAQNEALFLRADKERLERQLDLLSPVKRSVKQMLPDDTASRFWAYALAKDKPEGAWEHSRKALNEAFARLKPSQRLEIMEGWYNSLPQEERIKHLDACAHLDSTSAN